MMLPRLLKFKPDFLPAWLYWLLLAAGLLIGVCVAAVGLWVVSTQIEFM